MLSRFVYANPSSISKTRQDNSKSEDQIAGFVVLFQYDPKPAGVFRVAVQTRRMLEGVHHDPKKTELGS